MTRLHRIRKRGSEDRTSPSLSYTTHFHVNTVPIRPDPTERERGEKGTWLEEDSQRLYFMVWNSAAAILAGSRLLGRKFSCFQLVWKSSPDPSIDDIRPDLYRKFRFLWTNLNLHTHLVVGPSKTRLFSASGGGHFENGRRQEGNEKTFWTLGRPF